MSLLARCMIYIRIMSGYCPLSGYYPDIIRTLDIILILSGYRPCDRHASSCWQWHLLHLRPASPQPLAASLTHLCKRGPPFLSLISSLLSLLAALPAVRPAV